MFKNFYQNKKVLVTGHTGFKGSWLCHWLLNLGAEVAGFSLYIPSDPSMFQALKLDTRLKDYRGDIRNLKEVQATFSEFSPDLVFHLAAQPIVRSSLHDPKLTFDTNLGGTVNILEAVRNSAVERAILITSDKCYENVEWEYGYREIDRLGGKDPYSASKACAEIAISAYWRSFFKSSDKRIVSARAGNVIGGGDWAKDRIVPDCVRAWSQGATVTARNPDATRPWQHVLEPLSGYLCLGVALHDDAVPVAGEAFNFGPGADVNQPVGVLIEQLSSHWDGNASYDMQHDVLSKKHEAGLLKLSCDKALKALNWKAVLNFEETVAMTSKWYQSFYSQNCDMQKFTLEQIEAYCQLAKQCGVKWAT